MNPRSEIGRFGVIVVVGGRVGGREPGYLVGYGYSVGPYGRQCRRTLQNTRIPPGSEAGLHQGNRVLSWPVHPESKKFPLSLFFEGERFPIQIIKMRRCVSNRIALPRSSEIQHRDIEIRHHKFDMQATKSRL